MWQPEPRADSGSPGCPDLLLHVQTVDSPPFPQYFSFFEEECRAIAARLLLDAEPSPGPDEMGPDELSPLQPESAGPITSTPLPGPSHGRVPESSVGDCEAAAAPDPGPARGEPGCLPQPAAGAGPDARLARPSAPSRRLQRGAAQPSGGRPGSPASSPGRGRARLSRGRARASLGLRLPAAGTGRGAGETRLPQPPGTRLKMPSPAGSRLQRVSGASQQAHPYTRPKPAPRDRGMKTALKAASRKQPSSRPSTGIPILASRSSLRPPGKVASSKRFCPSKGSTTQELVCNRTQELKENGESQEMLVAAGTVLGAGKINETWLYGESSLSTELASGLTSGCEDAVPAKQSAGDQLSQELEHMKKELERLKGELADKTAQCEAYQQTISSLQAQLRAAGICLKDASVFDSGELRRD